MVSRGILSGLLALLFSSVCVSASVFLPYDAKATSPAFSKFTKTYQQDNYSRREVDRMRRAVSSNGAAVAIPGYGVAEQVFVGGFMNFLSIYNLVITGRILLSWFPQAQGIGFLQPVFQITDPYLNLFRGIIPPIFGLDLSPILAFVTLNALTSATAAVGSELTADMKKKMKKMPIVLNMK